MQVVWGVDLDPVLVGGVAARNENISIGCQESFRVVEAPDHAVSHC